MMIKIICFILIIILNGQYLFAYSINPVSDFSETTKSSFHFTRDYLPLYITVGVVTPVLFLYDQQITDSVHEIKGETFITSLKYMKTFGDGFFLLGVSSATILTGVIAKENKCTALGIYLTEGVIFSGIYASGIKFIFGRARPYVNDGPYTFKPFKFKTAYTSFYSGHTTEAFTAASIMSHYFQNIWLSIIFYSCATLTGIQRIYDKKHWASDVFIGAVSGELIGKKIVDLNEDYNSIKLDNDDLHLSFYTRPF